MQVEHTQHESEEGARQDNLGTLQWEAHIEVQHSAAVPPQQAATAGISSQAAGGPGQVPSTSGAASDGAQTVEQAHTAGPAPSMGSRAVASPSELPSSSGTAGDGAQTPDQGPSEAPAPSTGTQSSPAATGQAAEVAAPQSSAQPSTAAQATLHKASAQPADAAAAGPEPAPWSDADGRLNEPYWRSLTQRAMSAVLRSPGASTQHHSAPLREMSRLYDAFAYS